MTASFTTDSGVPGVGALPWGTHFCHFYESAADLADTLVPYFETGLARGEACLWVTSEPVSAEQARESLAAVVPDLRERERRGQIEIVDHHDWYLRTGKAEPASTLRGWLEREERALADGWAGLRLTGNTYWLERRDWQGFVEYESLVSSAFAERRIVALCSYCFGRCSASDVLDVVRNHHFSVARRGGVWEVVESAQLQLAREDLRRLRSAWEALCETDRRKDELFAIVGHELRNPLAPIRGAVEIMRLRGATGFERELRVIERQLEHMTKLVDDLLDVASLSGELALQRGPVDVLELLGAATDVVRDAVAAHRQTLSISAEPGLVVDGDARRLVQVVSNLLGNATKHGREGGGIRVSAARSGGCVEIRVADDGPGIAPALLPRVFEPFVQGPQGSERGRGGLGIGLTLVKRIVELHGGTVTAESEPGRGASFVVRLPARPPVAAAPPPARALAVGPPRRVLVVDDNADAAEMLGEVLRLLGHTPLVTHHPREALLRAEAEPFDVALVDLGLPEMDGWALARALAERRPGVPIVALSGYAQAEDRAKSAALGFAAHLAKPVEAAEIAAVIARVTPA